MASFLLRETFIVELTFQLPTLGINHAIIGLFWLTRLSPRHQLLLAVRLQLLVYSDLLVEDYRIQRVVLACVRVSRPACLLRTAEYRGRG